MWSENQWQNSLAYRLSYIERTWRVHKAWNYQTTQKGQLLRLGQVLLLCISYSCHDLVHGDIPICSVLILLLRVSSMLALSCWRGSSGNCWSTRTALRLGRGCMNQASEIATSQDRQAHDSPSFCFLAAGGTVSSASSGPLVFSELGSWAVLSFLFSPWP